MIGSLQLFDMVWILTGGGPANSTTTMATFLVTEGTKRQNYGIASAASVILFVVALVFALLYQLLRPAPRHPRTAGLAAAAMTEVPRRPTAPARRPPAAPQPAVTAAARPLVYAAALVVVALTLGPVLYAVLGGFRTNAQLAESPAGLPDPWVLDNYRNVLTTSTFWRYALNSTVVAVITTAPRRGARADGGLPAGPLPVPRAASRSTSSSWSGCSSRPRWRSSRCSSWSPATCRWATPGGAWRSRRRRSRCR